MNLLNVYALDECSILHLCKLKIPGGFIKFYDKQNLVHGHYDILKEFISKLDLKKIPKYRFEPSNIKQNALKVANELLIKQGNQILVLGTMGSVLKAQLIDQLEEFKDTISSEFKTILKKDEINSIKNIFVNNKRELTKESDIPENDDLKIIAGYIDLECESSKYLISDDEHFWGYKDLIKNNFGINVIEEWSCNKIKV
jgi:hypothetical protein